MYSAYKLFSEGIDTRSKYLSAVIDDIKANINEGNKLIKVLSIKLHKAADIRKKVNGSQIKYVDINKIIRITENEMQDNLDEKRKDIEVWSLDD